MRRSLFLVCAICGSLVGTQAEAQPGGGRGGELGGSGQADRPRPVRAAMPVDEDLRQIQLEIAILDVPAAEVAAKPLNDEEQLARLGRLETEGKLAGVQRIKTTLIANQIGQFQMGETVQVVTGRSSRPPGDPAARGGFGGGFNEIRTAQQVGTLVSVTARPISGGAVAEITLERSGIIPQRQPEAADAPVGDIPKSRQLTIKTTALFADGEMKIIGSNQQARTDGGKEETWVLAKVTVGAPGKIQHMSAIKVFTLQNSRAEEAVQLIQSLYGRGSIQAFADRRTNSVIVKSAVGDEGINEIEAVVNRLDESDVVQKPAPDQKPQPIPDRNDAPLFNPAPQKK